MIRKEYFVKRYDAQTSQPVALSVLAVLPETEPRFVLQILHGFTDRKERWTELMEAAAEAGGAVLIHDLRGYGNTVRSEDELGCGSDFGYHDEILTGDIDAVYASLDENPKDGQLLEGRLPDGLKTPEVPRYLLGFSFGALAASIYAARRTDTIAGLILAGLPKRRRTASFALFALRCLSFVCGADRKPAFLERAVQKRYNKPFDAEPGTDGKYLWLSDDCENRLSVSLDKYTGYRKSIGAYENFKRLQRDVYRPSSWEVPRSGLPLLMMAGENDPVSGGDKGVLDALRFFEDIGFSRSAVPAEAKMYRGMRHEIFRDTGRENPMADVIAFCEAHLERENERLEAIRSEYRNVFTPEA